MSVQKFALGQVVATPMAIKAFERNDQAMTLFLRSHLMGNWGELSSEDRVHQNEALKHEGTDRADRMMSVWKLRDATKIWIITEWDRSVTTVLLPEEY